MITYTIELTDEEYTILSYYHNPELWVEGLFTHRANVAIEEMFKAEIQQALSTNKSVPADRDQAILQSTLTLLANQVMPTAPEGTPDRTPEPVPPTPRG
jgi:hypothetical protein